MRVEWSDGFDAFLRRLEADVDSTQPQEEAGRIARERLAHLGALLGEVRELQEPPEAESATFKKVRQARRHVLWRVAHPYNPDVAVRVIVWFAGDEKAVLCVFGFDKAKLGDVWYGRAATEGEAIVDEWLRQHNLGGTA
jgi:hypothetical protein